MTQCRVIGIEGPNGEPLNYILFSVYREDIRKLEEEIKKLKSDLGTVIDERDNAFKKIKQLEQRLDNKEKVNKQLREELGKFVMTPYGESICSRVSLDDLEQAKKDIGKLVMKH